jgi:predicted DNA-binding transcriptional regulator YafY
VEELAMLPIVQEAVARDRKLKIRYSGRRSRFERAVDPLESTTSFRILDPLGLVAKGSTWYLVANTAKGFRTFRISRIESAILLDVPCDRPANFDLEEHWKSSSQEFLKSWPRFEATLRLHPDAAQEMKLWRMVTQDPGGATPDGWTTLSVQFDDERQALFVVLGFGSKIEVLAPSNLRNLVTAEVTAALNAYSPSSVVEVPRIRT